LRTPSQFIRHPCLQFQQPIAAHESPFLRASANHSMPKQESHSRGQEMKNAILTQAAELSQTSRSREFSSSSTSISRQRAALTCVVSAGLCLLACAWSRPVFAQSADAVAVPESAAAAPESVVRWSSSLPESAGKTVELKFDLYQNPAGGVSLWSETQTVKVAADGKYTVLLGVTTPEGLPATLFAAGEARWVEAKLAGGNSGDNSAVSENGKTPRSLLAAVPYAFKSVDAASLGGRAASDYVTREELQATNSTNSSFTPMLSALTGTGTTNYIPVWTGAATEGNSTIYQSGTNVGINTTTPQTSFDVNGTFTARSDMRLNNEQVATSSAPRSSPLGEFVSSSYSSTLAAAVPQSFAWQAVGESNNTATPTGILELLSGSGSTYLSPTATGLSISATGGVTFAKGQGFLSFPLNAATASTSYNSPSTQWESNAYSSSTSKSVPQNFTLRAVASGNDTASPTGNLELFTGSGTGASNPTFTGLSIAPTGMISFASGQTFPLAGLETNLNGVYAQLATDNTFTAPLQNLFMTQLAAYGATGADYAALYGFGSSGTVGTYGDSDTYYGVWGRTNTPAIGSAGVMGDSATSFSDLYGNLGNKAANEVAGVWGDTTGNPNSTGGGSSGFYWAAGVLGTANGNNAGAFFNNSTNGFYTVWAEALGSSGALGGSAIGGDGVTGESSSGTGVYGSTSSGDGVAGSSSSGVGVYGSSGTGYGAEGYSYDSDGVFGESVGGGTAGTGLTGVSGLTPTPAPGNAGVFGYAYATSGMYAYVTAFDIVGGVWGDTADVNDGTGTTTVGLVATADDNEAALLANDSEGQETLEVANLSSGGTGLFKVFKASTPDGSCGIGGGGTLTCTGQVKTLATTGGGTRTVETYSTQSAENWMEDYGTGVMERGVAVVKIDPAFADTVSATEEYHIFLTPNGDSKGLYVINKTAASFEVRESGGGVSSLKFDYKIVAKRRGYEGQRLVDVTDRFNAEQKKSVVARAASIPRNPDGSLHMAAAVRPLSHSVAHAAHPEKKYVPNGMGASAPREVTTVPHKQAVGGAVSVNSSPSAHP
jgi:hypothetical protein